jgi:hypothetical protein
VIRSDAGGMPASASAQPAMMAIMLERPGLAAGGRLLEVGSGSVVTRVTVWGKQGRPAAGTPELAAYPARARAASNAA